MEKLSLVDFDGYVASTLFTGGCNFRCPFCHNSPLVLNYQKVQEISLEEIENFFNKRKGIIEGVCITGGEPTLYNDLPNLCEFIKKFGLKVKLDTNGTNPQMIKTLFDSGLCDYFAMDIKNDKDNYSKIIGIENFNTSLVEKSVELFLTSNINYEFRTTLIEEFHKEENIYAIGKWIKGANKYFMQKFKNGENCICNELSPVSEQEANAFVNIIKQFVPNTKLRGYN